MTHISTKVGLMVAMLALIGLPALAQEDPIPEPMLVDAPVPTLYMESDEELVPVLIMEEEGEQEPELIMEEETLPEVDTTLDGVNATEYSAEDVPTGNFGLWWKSVKENVSLAFTFDATKKAEKHLKFAEERMSMAEAMLEKAGDDPDLQAKAEAMIERSQSFMTKVEEKTEKWAAKADERSQKLIENLGAHVLRREALMDRLESKLPEDQAERLRELRDQGQEGAKRLMNALENENIPEAVREHLSDVKDRIEAHAEDVKAFRDEQKALLDRIQDDDDAAAEELRALRENRRESLKEDLEMRREEQKQQMEQKREAMKDAIEERDGQPAVRPIINRILNPDGSMTDDESELDSMMEDDDSSMDEEEHMDSEDSADGGEVDEVDEVDELSS